MSEHLSPGSEYENWKSPETGEGSSKELSLIEGEQYRVVRSNGQVEDDWELKSYGDKTVVIEKQDPNTPGRLRKVIPLSEFISWQQGHGSGKVNLDKLSPDLRNKLRGGLSEEEIRRITGK